MTTAPTTRVLSAPDVFRGERFDEATESDGAVLLECMWNGGRFASGVFIGGMFRSGEFAGGVFLGGIFWEGSWVAGVWEGGFDRNGTYHPRGDDPRRW